MKNIFTKEKSKKLVSGIHPIAKAVGVLFLSMGWGGELYAAEYFVNNANPSGAGSLAQAIANVNNDGGGTVVIDTPLALDFSTSLGLLVSTAVLDIRSANVSISGGNLIGGGALNADGWIELKSAARIKGGSGATGNTGSSGIAVGDGGKGGWGIHIASNSVSTNTGTIEGGVGGQGGRGEPGGAGGVGGVGGVGVQGAGLQGAGALLTNKRVIQGGAGGVGGAGGGAGKYSGVGGSGGMGGAGGAGISGMNLTVVNEGFIVGGAGGSGGGGGTGGVSGAVGANGAGGAGVVVTGSSSIYNAGTIQGGLGGDGVTRSNAIEFSGGHNVLTITSASMIEGKVISSSGSSAAGDTLALGGDSAATFDATQLGAAGSGAQYQGFARYRKTGGSVWTVTGASSTSGNWNIEQGALVAASSQALGSGEVVVGGAPGIQARLQVNSGVTLANVVTLAQGGILTGTGQVGTTTVQSGAAIATGFNTPASTPYGTLHVQGDLLLQSGATYLVQVDPGSGTSSHIDVSGTATLAGKVLHMGKESNPTTDFQIGQTYTILKAAHINGQFDSVASNYAYLDAALGYTSTDVTLKLQRKSNGGNTMGFADLAGTSNQASVARGIESLPSSHALYQHIETLSAGTPEAVLASLSGDTHASVAGSLVSLGARAPSISSQHLYSNLTAGMRSGAPVAQSSGTLPASAWPSPKALPAWAEVVGHWQTYNGDGNAARLKQNTAGLFVGMDQEVAGSGWRLGGSLGYTHADGRVADRSSTSKVDSYSAAVYGGKSFGTGVGPRINVLGGLAYTWHDIKTTRSVASLGQTLKADYSAHTAQLFAEVGYAIGQYDKFGLEPFVGVSLGEQRTRGFSEKGGFAALQGQGSTDNLASTTLGLRLHSDFTLAGKESRLRATVGWRHAFGDVSPQKTMAFEGGQNFTVAGAPLARNTALLGLEAEMALSRSAALVLGLRSELGSGQRDHAANVKLRWAF